MKRSWRVKDWAKRQQAKPNNKKKSDDIKIRL